MKCPFCAEQIQNEAIICRFCSAVKTNEQWTRDPAPLAEPESADTKPNTTLRIAGAFFVLSAFLELISVQSTVPLLGELRAGPIAIVYHLTWLSLFLAMGVGLWTTSRWGYRMMFVGTLLYTLDKIRYLFDDTARELEMGLKLQGFEGLLGPTDQSMILQLLDLIAIVSIICWWGFLLFVYFRRKLFDL